MKLNIHECYNAFIHCGINIKFNNDILYDYVINKHSITDDKYNIIDVEPDGNCYYRCLSLFLYGIEDYHSNLRQIIAFFCKEKYLIIKNFFDTVEIRKDKYIDLEKYIDLIAIDKTWATELDITMSSLIYSINIAIYHKFLLSINIQKILKV